MYFNQFSLLFQEQYSSAARTHSSTGSVHEDCRSKVLLFCKNVLHNSNPENNIQIDRAHRVGRYDRGKIRPIVAKLTTDSKYFVKNALKSVDLHATPYRVSDQFPQEVKERRKQLIPIMLQAREQGKRAVLVRDKLFIDNQLYRPPNTVSSVDS